MKSLSIEDIILFHEKIINQTGGSKGIRDKKLIESSINRAFATYGGKDLYPELIQKVSVITYSLINNHGFIDGNKRIGISTMIILLKINQIDIKYTQEELINLGLEIARGNIKENGILNWIKNHIE
ncbi:type II toxin-antitoxin system death-on-curing family toxin [Senegalia sp. (in: firmicutes)]